MIPNKKRKREKSENKNAVKENDTTKISAIQSLLSGIGEFQRAAPVDSKTSRDFVEQAKEVDAERKQKKIKKEVSGSAKSSSDIAIKSLNFKDLQEGLVLLGAVKEIRESEMIISLPGNLVGTLSITEINDIMSEKVAKYLNDDQSAYPDLKDTFSEGQYLICAIKGGISEGKKSVNLSILPQTLSTLIDSASLSIGSVAQGYVKSIEDYGAIIEFGSNNFTGFLKKDQFSLIQSVAPGSVVFGVVESKTKKVVHVNVCPEKLANTVCSSEKTIFAKSINPGCLVDAKVEEVASDGLIVKFFNLFEGSIDRLHALSGISETSNVSIEDLDMTNYYQKGQVIRARIICRLPIDTETSKIFMLSLMTNLCSLSCVQIPESISVGKIFTEAVIEKVCLKRGLEVMIDQETPSLKSLVLLNKIKDEGQISSSELQRIKAGSTLKCRVIGFDRFEGWVLLSSQESVLSSAFVSYDDAKIGKIVKDAVIVKVDSPRKFVVVKISPTLRALCSTIHLSDAEVTNMDKRFNVGDKVACMVLNIDKKNKKISVTMKKSLMKMKSPVFHDIFQVDELLKSNDDLWSMGVVTSVKDFGVFVQFFGDCVGLIPRNEVINSAQSDLQSVYFVGQVLKCRVINVNINSGKLTLSMRSKPKTLPNNFLVGSILEDCPIKSVLPDGFTIEFNGVDCFLPVEHLSDFNSVFKNLKNHVKTGMKIHELMVLSLCSSKSLPLVTAKHIFINVVKSKSKAISFPFDLKDLSSGDLVVGLVARVDPNLGAFISFGNGIVGLARKSGISDLYINDFTQILEIGQTVLCVIEFIDVSSNRISLFLKDSIVKERLGNLLDNGSLLTMSYFSYLKDMPQFQNIGKSFPGTIQNILGEGKAYEVKLMESETGIILKNSIAKQPKKFQIGSELTVNVADFDLNSGLYDLTSHLEKQAKDNDLSSCNDAIVILVKKVHSASLGLYFNL